ncbi:T7SS effector LXG polymorphic toxin [Numidum massiliense]|uniref:T7SS effector LXG polymorphic toxin n=1 Tax=Numidum massiliense TaxID=1522315 RepID=UPI0009EC5C19|nr:T7SS effector LXG polymorphic toxin [Numidum massiliense]
MGHQVDMSEVLSLSKEVTSKVEDVRTGLDSLLTSIYDFEKMDTFRGASADAAKGYLDTIHRTLILAFDELFSVLGQQFKYHIAKFRADVDKDDSAIIVSDYLRDHQDTITSEYDALNDTVNEVKQTIRNIADISHLVKPGTYSLHRDQSEVTKYIERLDRNLHKFTAVPIDDPLDHSSSLETILQAVHTVMAKTGNISGEARFKELKDGSGIAAIKTMKDIVGYARKGRTAVKGVITGYKMYQAAKDAGLETRVINGKDGKKYYEVVASEEALNRLGIKPNKVDLDKSISDPKRYNRLPKDKSQWERKHWETYKASRLKLRYVNNKGDANWSATGKEALKKYPEIGYMTDGASLSERTKVIGKAAWKGTVTSFKDIGDFKGIAKSGFVKGTGKALAPVGAGLSFYSNYQEAKDAGLRGIDATARATVDTAIDTAVGGAVQAATVATFTATIPIPGVGTAIGVGAGILINSALNIKFGKSKKSVMDRIKGWFH